jgi:hypothetical protein
VSSNQTQAKLNLVCTPTCSPSFSYWARRTCSSAGFSGLIVGQYRSSRALWLVIVGLESRYLLGAGRTFLHQQHLKAHVSLAWLFLVEEHRGKWQSGYEVEYPRLCGPYLQGREEPIFSTLFLNLYYLKLGMCEGSCDVDLEL